jgi:hypothetical protein
VSTYSCVNTLGFSKTIEEEEPGAYSRCIEVTSGSINSSGCFKMKCNGNELIFTVKS